MSYLLSSLKNAEEQRKQKICQDEIKSLDQSDDKELNQSCNHAFEMKSTNEAHQNNFILENSSNQFSTKKKLTYAFLISGICIVAILCMFWLYMLINSSQDNKFIPDTFKGTVQSQDNLQLKLETELEFPVSTNKQQKHSATNKN